MNLTAADFLTFLQAELPPWRGVILDVRTPMEWGFGGLSEGQLRQLSQPGAVFHCLRIPLSELLERAALEIPQGFPIVVYCAHGVRSQTAQQLLSQLGYQKVYSLEGGFAAWSQLVR